MILFWQDSGRRLCQALDWSLYSAKGERVSLHSEEALVGYLREHPDTEYHLRNYRLREDMASHREIDLQAADCGPESGHLFCGAIRYDSAAGRVVSTGARKGRALGVGDGVVE
jgi:hypothetical protein